MTETANHVSMINVYHLWYVKVAYIVQGAPTYVIPSTQMYSLEFKRYRKFKRGYCCCTSTGVLVTSGTPTAPPVALPCVCQW